MVGIAGNKRVDQCLLFFVNQASFALHKSGSSDRAKDWCIGMNEIWQPSAYSKDAMAEPILLTNGAGVSGYRSGQEAAENRAFKTS